MNGVKELEELLAQSDMNQVRSMENKEGVICIASESTSVSVDSGGRGGGRDSGHVSVAASDTARVDSAASVDGSGVGDRGDSSSDDGWEHLFAVDCTPPHSPSSSTKLKRPRLA